MVLDTISVGELRTNCYILTLNNDVLVIDPGDEYQKIKPYIQGKNVSGVLITHNHSDHIGAIDNFNQDCIYGFKNLKVGMHQIGPFKFEVIYTPGHAEDCLTYYFADKGMMFTGDFLFRGTIGRTDFEGGNPSAMKRSIEKIKKYPDALVYPGHGMSTSLQAEKENNIYFLKG